MTPAAGPAATQAAADLEEFDASLLSKSTGEAAPSENKSALPELVLKTTSSADHEA